LVDTSASGVLVPEGIICQVVSASVALTWFIRYIFLSKCSVPKSCNYY